MSGRCSTASALRSSWQRRCARSRARATGSSFGPPTGRCAVFDGVVVATSAPRALALLEDASADEREILSAFETTTNETVLHTDARLLPRDAIGSLLVELPVARLRRARQPGRRSRTRSTGSRGSTRRRSTASHSTARTRSTPPTVIRVIDYEHPADDVREPRRGRARPRPRASCATPPSPAPGRATASTRTASLGPARCRGVRGALVKSALYVGTVMHARRSPHEHVFRYPVYMALLDLDELPTLDRRFRLFGWNRRAVTSFHDADHIDIHAILAEHGVELGDGGSIQVLTNLRVLGYVFNPVSFWWCRRGDGSLACIVAEVNNTFGERLPYVLLPAEGSRPAVARSSRPTSGCTSPRSCRWIRPTPGGSPSRARGSASAWTSTRRAVATSTPP